MVACTKRQQKHTLQRRRKNVRQKNKKSKIVFRSSNVIQLSFEKCHFYKSSVKLHEVTINAVFRLVPKRANKSPCYQHMIKEALAQQMPMAYLFVTKKFNKRRKIHKQNVHKLSTNVWCFITKWSKNIFRKYIVFTAETILRGKCVYYEPLAATLQQEFGEMNARIALP